MVGGLRVAYEELYRTAARLKTVAADMRESHDRVHGDMQACVSGLGLGQSARALGDMLTAWEKTTAEHHETLTNHSDAHVEAAHTYRGAEERGRDGMTKLGSQLPHYGV